MREIFQQDKNGRKQTFKPALNPTDAFLELQGIVKEHLEEHEDNKCKRKKIWLLAGGAAVLLVIFGLLAFVFALILTRGVG